jgi:hypothetical protein
VRYFLVASVNGVADAPGVEAGIRDSPCANEADCAQAIIHAKNKRLMQFSNDPVEG